MALSYETITNLEKIEVNSPQFRGVPVPKVREEMINEMRFKTWNTCVC